MSKSPKKSSAKKANAKTARDVKSAQKATNTKQPSARARSTREASTAAERHARTAARPDPTQLSSEERGINTAAAESKSDYTKNNPPGQQVGPSSSELNTQPPGAKDRMIPDQEGPDQSPEKK